MMYSLPVLGYGISHKWQTIIASLYTHLELFLTIPVLKEL